MGMKEITEPVSKMFDSIIEVLACLPADRDIHYNKELLKSIKDAMEIAKQLGLDTSDVTLGSLLEQILEKPKAFPFLAEVTGRIEGYIREESGGEGNVSFKFPILGGLLGGGGSGYSNEVDSGACTLEVKAVYNELNQNEPTFDMSRMLEMKIPELTNILETKVKVHEADVPDPVIDNEEPIPYFSGIV